MLFIVSMFKWNIRIWKICLGFLLSPMLFAGENVSFPDISTLGIHVFKKLSERQKEPYRSFTFSPLNMAASLELIKGLAPEQSRQQLENILGSGKNYEQLIRCLSVQQSSHSTTSIHSLLIFNRKFPIPDNYPYVKLADIRDFTQERQLALDISQWVQEKSNGKFSSLFTPDLIQPKRRFILTSILNIGIAWEVPFKPGNTRPAQFYLAPGQAIRVKMMENDTFFCPHGKKQDCEFVTIPCKNTPEGHQIAMTCIIPSGKQPLRDLIAQLTPEQLQEILKTKKSEDIKVSLISLKLPRFSNITRQLDLIDPLATFPGLENVFAVSPDERAIWKQSCTIAVNERGIAAKAMDEVSDPFAGSFHTYIFNRPFMWVIHDMTEPVIMFMGTFSPPFNNKDRNQESVAR